MIEEEDILLVEITPIVIETPPVVKLSVTVMELKVTGATVDVRKLGKSTWQKEFELELPLTSFEKKGSGESFIKVYDVITPVANYLSAQADAIDVPSSIVGLDGIFNIDMSMIGVACVTCISRGKIMYKYLNLQKISFK